MFTWFHTHSTILHSDFVFLVRLSLWCFVWGAWFCYIRCRGRESSSLGLGIGLILFEDSQLLYIHFYYQTLFESKIPSWTSHVLVRVTDTVSPFLYFYFSVRPYESSRMILEHILFILVCLRAWNLLAELSLWFAFPFLSVTYFCVPS